MKCAIRRACHLAVGITALFLLGFSSPVDAEEPTLARLVFWVPTERLDEFGAAFAEQVVPILKQHEFTESSQPGRPTADSVFSRLFEFRHPVEVSPKLEELWEDPAWRELRRNLGTAFATGDPDGLIAFESHL